MQAVFGEFVDFQFAVVSFNSNFFYELLVLIPFSRGKLLVSKTFSMTFYNTLFKYSSAYIDNNHYILLLLTFRRHCGRVQEACL